MNCSSRIARFSGAAVALALAAAPQAARATTIYTLTPAEQYYSFLSQNLIVNKPPVVDGTAGLFTGGLLTLSSGVLNGEADFQGSRNDNNSGTYSVTGGEFANVPLVGTAASDAAGLAATVAALTPTATFTSITSSQTLTAGVYDVQTINLGSTNTLTLSATSASDQFVIRVSTDFILGSNAQIVFSGPVDLDNVLFYYTGPNGVTFGGNSVFQGILLDNASSAQTFTFISHDTIGPSNGRVFNISGGDVFFSSGTWNGTGGGGSVQATPEPATYAITGLGLIALSLIRRRR